MTRAYSPVGRGRVARRDSFAACLTTALRTPRDSKRTIRSPFSHPISRRRVSTASHCFPSRSAFTEVAVCTLVWSNARAGEGCLEVGMPRTVNFFGLSDETERINSLEACCVEPA